MRSKMEEKKVSKKDLNDIDTTDDEDKSASKIRLINKAKSRSFSSLKENDERRIFLSSILSGIVDSAVKKRLTTWSAEDLRNDETINDETSDEMPAKRPSKRIARKNTKSLLPFPVTDKCTVYLSNGNWKVIVGFMQGWRKKMEDAHVALLQTPSDPDVAFFGVFDGHGGNDVSTFVSRNLHKFILESEHFRQGDIDFAIKEGYLNMDNFLRNEEIGKGRQGTTAITVLIKDNYVYCANVGDSRAIAVIDGEVIPLSSDHKPSLPTEYRRIIRTGSSIHNNRVNGGLAMSRSLGDFRYKSVPYLKAVHQPVIALPVITKKELNEKWEFVVIACDGIWDVMTNESVADFVKQGLKNDTGLSEICESLFQNCLAPNCLFPSKGCDNMTALIILISEELAKQTSLDGF